MKLFSCPNCGVVLDEERFYWPRIKYWDDYSEPPKSDSDLSTCGRLVGRYVNDELTWKPTLPCPVCKNPLTELDV